MIFNDGTKLTGNNAFTYFDGNASGGTGILNIPNVGTSPGVDRAAV